jgi:hypothetical protein
MSSPDVVVAGCAEERLNGLYRPEPGAQQTAGRSRPHRQLNGTGTLEFGPAPVSGHPEHVTDWAFSIGQTQCWLLTERCSVECFYSCDSSSPTPPPSDWEVSDNCVGKAPPPSLTLVERAPVRGAGPMSHRELRGRMPRSEAQQAEARLS